MKYLGQQYQPADNDNGSKLDNGFFMKYFTSVGKQMVKDLEPKPWADVREQVVRYPYVNMMTRLDAFIAAQAYRILRNLQ